MIAKEAQQSDAMRHENNTLVRCAEDYAFALQEMRAGRISLQGYNEAMMELLVAASKLRSPVS